MEELYRKNVSARGIALPDQQFRIEIGLSSTFHEAHLEVVAHQETRVISAASGELTRAPEGEHCIATTARLNRLVGLNLGAGFGRAAREAVGGPTGCKRWEELALAAALAIIQCGTGLKRSDMSEAEWAADRERMTLLQTDDKCRRLKAHRAVNYADFVLPAGHRHRTHEVYRGYWFSCVWRTDPHTLRVQSSLGDTYHYPWVVLDVDLATRRINRIQGDLSRSPRGPICNDTAELLQGLVGQVAWPTETKTVRETVGGPDGCSRFEEVVNEAYRAVYQAHYAQLLREHMADPPRNRRELYGFLKDTCRAFTDFGSDPKWNPQAAGAPLAASD